ncbi:HD domain-containing protein [Pontibacter sp. 172403-2]|uniref:HD domain-containing protein n=1 Tax=Pontibacter rufus TaxID=2791028 RepID=UPI0018AF87FA|nr:HD domain-containing protein [Pontibacter sp. 172403-2]MBF9252240.1 HD domain-containing protein [Pontibacter sp. 172403-2]
MIPDKYKQTLIQKAEAFCTQLLKSKLPANLVFHNYQHTAAVAKAAYEIGLHSGLSAEEMQVLLVAAWFHDTGYRDKYKGHEEISKQIATDFLRTQGAHVSFREQVAACIEATRQAQQPETLPEQALCDADLSHLGKPSFPTSSQKLRKERELVSGTTIPDREWHCQNISFLESHTFFTSYAKGSYDAQKNKNILRERELLPL